MKFGETKILKFDELGLSLVDQEKIQRVLTTRSGLIFVGGLPKSGKTATLYSIIEKLKKNAKIYTCEDRIFRKIIGVNQLQVQGRHTLTSAKCLRSILHQEPEVIVVDEIQDAETMKLVFEAVLKNYLFLASLEAKDAFLVLEKLKQFQIEPFLIASTVSLIIGQKLVRRLCPNCRRPASLTEQQIEWLNTNPEVLIVLEKLKITDLKNVKVFENAGCDFCRSTNDEKRIGIFEVFEITGAVRRLIAEKVSPSDLRAILIKEKIFSPMLEDGLRKAFDGLIDFDDFYKSV